jgi:predicted RNase H-like HicB family nuclease
MRSDMQYLVVIEQGTNSFGAYVPDLPGCVAAAETREEVASLIQEAIELHIDDLKARGNEVPAPHSSGELVSVDA